MTFDVEESNRNLPVKFENSLILVVSWAGARMKGSDIRLQIGDDAPEDTNFSAETPSRCLNYGCGRL